MRYKNKYHPSDSSAFRNLMVNVQVEGPPGADGDAAFQLIGELQLTTVDSVRLKGAYLLVCDGRED